MWRVIWIGKMAKDYNQWKKREDKKETTLNKNERNDGG